MSSAEVASTTQPVRKPSHRQRWFAGAFQEQVDKTAMGTGNQFSVGKVAWAEVFAACIKAFEAPKPSLQKDNTACFVFADASLQTAFMPAWRSGLRTHHPIHLPKRAYT